VGISNIDIFKSALKYSAIMIAWNIVSFVGFFSTGVIWAFVAKHYFDVKFRFWWLNDTEDGDYGADWFMPKWKRSWFTAFCWWFRNHSWNFITYEFTPVWENGKADAFRTIWKWRVVDNEEYGRYTRAHKKDKNYGIKFIAYRIGETVEFQFSAACRIFQLHIGAGGDRYRFNWKF
jgi:hypothetical protein